MSLSAVEVIGIISAAVFGPEYFVLRGKEKSLGIFADSLMCGCIGMGILTYIVLPNTAANVVLLGSFAPHAYNLIIWPLGALLLLRPRFGLLMIPVLAFVYGLDEIIWNAFATARLMWTPGAFSSTGLLWYEPTSSWQILFLGFIALAIGGYLLLRPRVKLKNNAGLLTMLLFIVFWMAIGLPAGALNWFTLSLELFWQAVFWLFVGTTFFPRGSK